MLDAQESGIEQAQNKAIDALNSPVFNIIEGLVMPPKFGDDRHIVDYEPEKMAGLVTNGNMPVRYLTMYRSACEGHASIHGGLDETRGHRYQNVVAALELLA